MDHAFRISIDISEDGAQVASVRRIAMRVPAGQGSNSARVRAQVGYFVELRDADGHVLYRRPVRGELGDAIEVRTGVSNPQFRRVSQGSYRRRGVVIVPDLPRRARVVVCENRMGKKSEKSKAATLQSRELIGVDLPQNEKEPES